MKVEIKIVVDIPDDAIELMNASWDDLKQTVFDGLLQPAVTSHIESKFNWNVQMAEDPGNKDRYSQLLRYHQTWFGVLNSAELSVEPLLPMKSPGIA